MTDTPTRAEGAWKIVPVEPLPEMIGAWYRQKNTGSQAPGVEGADRSDYAAYRAMLAASPAAPDIAAYALQLEEEFFQFRDKAWVVDTELRAENARLRKALEPLWLEVFGGDELGAEPNVYADYDRLTELKRLTRAALTPQEGRG